MTGQPGAADVTVLADHTLLLAMPAFAPAVVVVAVVVYVAMRDRQGAIATMTAHSENTEAPRPRMDHRDDNRKTLTAFAAAALITAACGGSGESPEASRRPAPSGADIGRTRRRPVRRPGAADPARHRRHDQGRRGHARPMTQLQAKAQRADRHARQQRRRRRAARALESRAHVQRRGQAGQSFQFTVDVPGKVDIELHQLNRTDRDHQVQ